MTSHRTLCCGWGGCHAKFQTQDLKQIGRHPVQPRMPSVEHAYPEYKPFKARPLNPKVLASSGDLGVPRVAKPPPTKARPFNLSSSGGTRDSTSQNTKPGNLQPSRPHSARGSSRKTVHPTVASQAPHAVSKPTQVPLKPAKPAAETAAEPAANATADEATVMSIEPTTKQATKPAMTAATTTAIVLTSVPTAEPSLELTCESGAIAAPSPPDVLAMPSARLPPKTTLQRIEEIRAEFYADDLAIDVAVMGAWSEAEVREFFESGGQTMAAPPVVQELSSPHPAANAAHTANNPATPELALIRAFEIGTPDTVELP
jgi:hypothetical protein